MQTIGKLNSCRNKRKLRLFIDRQPPEVIRLAQFATLIYTFLTKKNQQSNKPALGYRMKAGQRNSGDAQLGEQQKKAGNLFHKV